MKFKADPDDVLRAVSILEAEPDVEVWEIGKITNTEHAIRPYGIGFGVSVWDKHGVIFEKASDRTLVTAATEAIRRLKVRVQQIEQSK